MRLIRIGTRGSLLAMAQSRLVADALRRVHGDVRVELVPIVTGGDRCCGPLAAVGGKGLFTAELEDALRSGAIDLAVHSAKDLPVDMPDEFVIAAVPERADPRDAIISRCGGLENLPTCARVGTGSIRRRAQLLAVRSDLEIVPIRGNVETRLAKVLDDDKRQVDATVLAMAGLKRSGLLETHADKIDVLNLRSFIPAAGQGALVVQAAGQNTEVIALAGKLNDPISHQALEAERLVVRKLGADCHSCVAVHVFPDGGSWNGLAMAGRADGSEIITAEAQNADARTVAEILFDTLDKQDAVELLKR